MSHQASGDDKIEIVSSFNKERLKEKIAHEKIFHEKLEGDHVNYLYKYLKHFNCKSFIVEKEYIDKDFLIDFSNYYVRCFEDYEKKCKRLHFFKIHLTQEDFDKALEGDKQKIELMRKNYLGCVVIKPLPEAVIGKTLLKTYEREVKGQPNAERHFPCTREYYPNLCGIEFKIKTLAFQEQDTVAAACATSALWSAFNQTAKIFEGTFSPSPVEITHYATLDWNIRRLIPNEGLSLLQMCRAVRKVNLIPEVIDYKEKHKVVPLISYIYAYLKAGIPVILNVGTLHGYHSMTVCGFKFNKNRVLKREILSGKFCHLFGQHIDILYVHDDRLGPFCALEIKEIKEKIPLIFELTYPNGKKALMYPHSLIVPLYHKIRIGFLTIYKWIIKFDKIIEKMRILDGKLEWDIYLAKNNDYKKDIIENKPKQYPVDFLKKPLPRYIWVCTAYFKSKPIFELIADTTDMQRSLFLKDMIFFDKTFKEIFHNRISNKLITDAIKIALLMEGYTEYPAITEKFIDFLRDKSK